jgi:lipopolysaccharide biosynthesis regulator YciM
LLETDPDNLSALLNLGFSFQDCGLFERAIDCFEKVRTLSESGNSYAQKAGKALSEIQKQTLDFNN